MAIFFDAAVRIALFASTVNHIVWAADDVQDDIEGASSYGNESDYLNLSDGHLEKFHAEADANSDSEVAQSELANVVEEHHQDVMKERTKHLFAQRDASKDGLISLEEHVKATVPAVEDGEYDHEVALFKAADQDKNGFLDRSELGMLQSPQKNSEVMNIVTKSAIDRTDFDDDGKLNLDEFTEQFNYKHATLGSSENVFSNLDQDKDGFLDKDELQHFHSGKLERETLVKNYISKMDADGDSHLDVQEMVQGKEGMTDSGLQDYLIAWASKRNLPKMVV